MPKKKSRNIIRRNATAVAVIAMGCLRNVDVGAVVVSAKKKKLEETQCCDWLKKEEPMPGLPWL